MERPLPLLPPEIFRLILRKLRHTETLGIVCEATKYVPSLYLIAASEAAREVRIEFKDFLPAPHIYHEPNHSSSDLENQGLLHELLSPPPQVSTSTLAAEYIRILSIDFSPSRQWELFISSGSGFPYKDVDHTIALLLPPLKLLTQLNLNWILCQSQFDMITGLRSLKVLKLRRNSQLECPLTPHNNQRLLVRDRCLRWDNLAHLNQLYHLEIASIVSDEAISLGNALVPLARLRKLVVVGHRSEGYQASRSATDPGSMDHFLSVIFPENGTGSPRALLPPGLVSLGLDTQRSEIQDTSIAETDGLIPMEAPRELFLGGLDVDVVERVLNAWSITNVSSLWLSASVLLSQSPAAERILSTLNGCTSLDQIGLLDIWGSTQNPSDKLESFLPEDLVLRTRNDEFYNSEPKPAMVGDFFGYIPKRWRRGQRRCIIRRAHTWRWDRHLQRIRIHQVILNERDPKFEPLTPEQWPELRILMLQPWKDRQHTNIMAKNRHVVLDSDYTLEEVLERAEFLAQRVLEKGLPKLQVLVLGGHWFWISRAWPYTIGRILHFASAQEDETEARSIRNDLSEHDWNFLLDLPPTLCHADIRAIADRAKRLNYTMLYRSGQNQKTESGASRCRGRQFGQGTTMLSAIRHSYDPANEPIFRTFSRRSDIDIR